MPTLTVPQESPRRSVVKWTNNLKGVCQLCMKVFCHSSANSVYQIKVNCNQVVQVTSFLIKAFSRAAVILVYICISIGSIAAFYNGIGIT